MAHFLRKILTSVSKYEAGDLRNVQGVDPSEAYKAGMLEGRAEFARELLKIVEELDKQ